MNGPVMIGVLFSTGVAHTNTSRKSVASPFSIRLLLQLHSGGNLIKEILFQKDKKTRFSHGDLLQLKSKQ